MFKYRWLIVVICYPLLLSSCNAENEHYYRVHPEQLQKSVTQCEQQKSNSKKCQQLRMLAIEINQLAYALQRNPQAFGQDILKIQQKLAHLEQQQKKDQKSKEITLQIKQNKRLLSKYLAVVRWLESPES